VSISHARTVAIATVRPPTVSATGDCATGSGETSSAAAGAGAASESLCPVQACTQRLTTMTGINHTECVIRRAHLLVHVLLSRRPQGPGRPSPTVRLGWSRPRVALDGSTVWDRRHQPYPCQFNVMLTRTRALRPETFTCAPRLPTRTWTSAWRWPGEARCARWNAAAEPEVPHPSAPTPRSPSTPTDRGAGRAAA